MLLQALARARHRAQYLLFVDAQAVGVVEAKKEGETLTGVAKYVDGLPNAVPTAVEGALPFADQSAGVETRFTNTPDPVARKGQPAGADPDGDGRGQDVHCRQLGDPPGPFTLSARAWYGSGRA